MFIPHICLPLFLSSQFDNPVLTSIGSKYGKTTAQVMGRWCVQKNVVYIPKSVKERRMRENAGVWDWEIEQGDMERLDGLTGGENLKKMYKSYGIGVLRDTTFEGRTELVRDITMG